MPPRSHIIGKPTRRRPSSAVVYPATYLGTGAWRPFAKTNTNVQSASAVEHGRGAGADEITAANYPNTQLRMFYKHGGVAQGTGSGSAARDACATIITADEALALGSPAGSWRATSGGTPMHGSAGNGGTSSWYMDLGNAAYQAFCVTEVKRFADDAVARGESINGVYFDNVAGWAYTDGVSTGAANQLDVVPDGYANNRAWRYNAVLPWLTAVADALAPYYYCVMNMGPDIQDTSIGETFPGSYNDTTTQYRYWTEVDTYLRAHSAYPASSLPGFFFEFGFQLGDGTKRYIGTSSNQRWTEYQGLVAHAQTTLGRDFHCTAVESATFTTALFERCSFLLDADLTRRGTIWFWYTSDTTLDLNDSALITAVGYGTSAHLTTSLGLHYRTFVIQSTGVVKTVIVNPTNASITDTVPGVGSVTRGASTGLIV